MPEHEITLKDVMETMIHHHEVVTTQLEKVETEVAGLTDEVAGLSLKIDQVHQSATEEYSALNNDLIEVKKFVEMPLPVFE